MIAPRWRKVLRDIGERPLAAALAVVAMAAGVFGLGMVLGAYSILHRELAAAYARTVPASAILVVDDLTDAQVESVRRLPGVQEAEARPLIRGRIRVGDDEWAPLYLFVVRDFRDVRVDTIQREEGAWPPGEGDVLLERTALTVARAEIGARVVLKTAEGPERSVRVAGTVHAAGLAPAWMDHVVSGFVPWGSVMRGDGEAESMRLRIVAAGSPTEEDPIRELAARAKAALEAQGRSVWRIDVPPPGRHPHADQMDTFLFLLGAFGALTLVLSGVLVANLTHALLAERMREIGVMKAIGATTRQVAALQLGQISILAAAALAVGIPLGLEAGRGYAGFAASILNMTIASEAVPIAVTVALILVGLVVPLLIALVPVVRASRVTVHEALGDGIARRPFGTRRLDVWLARRSWLSRPLMLSLRAAFHRPGRLFLTVGALAVGGAAFVAALNVSAAWARTLAADARARRYDLEIRLSRPYPADLVARAVAEVPDAVRSEAASNAGGVLVAEDGEDGERMQLVGVDPDSPFFDLPVREGRWLDARDERAIVVNPALVSQSPGVAVGRDVTLRVGDRTEPWRVVGIVSEASPFPTAYAVPVSVRGASGEVPGTTRGLRVVTRLHDEDAVRSVSRDLERALLRAGVGVLDLRSLEDRRRAFADHLVIIESALVLAAALVVLVGGLGLATTLTLSVLERTREMGILAAIGATPRAIALLVVAEGVVIAVMSWCVAIVLAAPVTLALDTVAGRMFHKAPLAFYFSPAAAAEWLALVVVLGALSSLVPARRAARRTVREAIAHA